MEIRSSLEGLQSLLGVDAPGAAEARQRGAAGAGTAGADRATLSSAGSEVSQSAANDGVRMEKVSSIQAALAAGTYHVPAVAVASRLVDAMLGGGQ